MSKRAQNDTIYSYGSRYTLRALLRGTPPEFSRGLSPLLGDRSLRGLHCHCEDHAKGVGRGNLLRLLRYAISIYEIAPLAMTLGFTMWSKRTNGNGDCPFRHKQYWRNKKVIKKMAEALVGES